MAERWMALVVMLCAALPAQAQRRAEPSQGLYARVQAAQFRNTGDLDTLTSYNFDAVLLGLGYVRGGLRAEMAYGTSSTPSGNVGVLDIDLSTRSALPLLDTPALTIELPVVFGLSYRRVRPDDTRSLFEFEVSALGLASGIAAQAPFGRATADASLTAGASIATRNFDGTPGVLYTGAAHAGLRTPVGERFRLLGGYRFRFRQWNLSEGQFGLVQRSDLFDYRALDHGVYLGLLF